MLNDQSADPHKCAGIHATEPGDLLHESFCSSRTTALRKPVVAEFAPRTMCDFGRDNRGRSIKHTPPLSEPSLRANELVIGENQRVSGRERDQLGHRRCEEVGLGHGSIIARVSKICSNK